MNQCAKFVGRSEINRFSNEYRDAFFEHGGPMEKAMIACELLDMQYRRNCIEQFAWFYIPQAASSDVLKMKKACAAIPTIYQGACVQSVAVGIKRTLPESDIALGKFCSIIAQQYRNECLEAAAITYLPSDRSY